MNYEIARHWRLKAQRYSLIGEKCENGHFVFPPRDICPDCHGEAKIPHQFSGKGEVYTFTDNMALVKLEEGPMITAQLTDLDPGIPVKIGMPVEMVTWKYTNNDEDGDDKGPIPYGYKFRPVF